VGTKRLLLAFNMGRLEVLLMDLNAEVHNHKELIWTLKTDSLMITSESMRSSKKMKQLAKIFNSQQNPDLLLVRSQQINIRVIHLTKPIPNSYIIQKQNLLQQCKLFNLLKEMLRFL
jgi:hypothetical protein